ncbi:hypothetical protein D3C81_2332350 [compost metagenome]
MAVPALAGDSDTSVAAVNGPPVASVVSSTTAATPAFALTRRETATGTWLMVIVVVIGAEAP